MPKSQREICGKCGARLKRDSAFCSHCGTMWAPAGAEGAGLDAGPEVPERDGSNWGCLLYLVSFLIFPVGLGIGYWMLRTRKDRHSRQEGFFFLALGAAAPVLVCLMWVVSGVFSFKEPRTYKCGLVVLDIVRAEEDFLGKYDKYTNSIEQLEGLLGRRLPIEENCRELDLEFVFQGNVTEQSGIDFKVTAKPKDDAGGSCRVIGAPNRVYYSGQCKGLKDQPEWIKELLKKEEPKEPGAGQKKK